MKRFNTIAAAATAVAIASLSSGAFGAKIVQPSPTLPSQPASNANPLQKIERSFGLHAAPGKVAGKPAPVGEHTSLNKEDQEFLHHAAELNLGEIHAGLAAEKAGDPQIKKLAQRFLQSHQTAQKQLEKLAASKGITLPTQLDKAQQEKLDMLSKKTGADFDKQYLQDQVSGHEKAITLFEKEAKRTTDPDIKAWANHMLEGLKTHLTLAKGTHLEPVAESFKNKHQKHKQAPKKHITD